LDEGGFVRVCKVGAGTAVTGSFSFTVTGMKDPVVVPVGGCSKPPVDDPSPGHRDRGRPYRVRRFEDHHQAGRPGRFVLGREGHGEGTGRQHHQRHGRDVHQQGHPAPPPATLKVCKVAGPGVAVGQPFSFSVGTATVSVKAGSCSAPLTIATSPVTVKETATAGLAVKAITVTGVGSLVSGDLATGTASVKVASGATTVTYTNVKPCVTGCVRGDGYYQTHEDAVAKLVTKNGGTPPHQPGSRRRSTPRKPWRPPRADRSRASHPDRQGDRGRRDLHRQPARGRAV
jgi:hypothetical protein